MSKYFLGRGGVEEIFPEEGRGRGEQIFPGEVECVSKYFLGRGGG